MASFRTFPFVLTIICPNPHDRSMQMKERFDQSRTSSRLLEENDCCPEGRWLRSPLAKHRKANNPAGDFSLRDVAQPGSAFDWGSKGRRFKSCRPDFSQKPALWPTGQGAFSLWGQELRLREKSSNSRFRGSEVFRHDVGSRFNLSYPSRCPTWCFRQWPLIPAAPLQEPGTCRANPESLSGTPAIRPQ